MVLSPMVPGADASQGNLLPIFRAYLASALTRLSGEQYQILKSEQKAIVAAALSERVQVYVPDEYTGPKQHDELGAEEVFARDREQVLLSDLLIVQTEHASFGAGMEIEFARSTLMPILLLSKPGIDVSRMVRGSPGVKHEETYSSASDVGIAVQRGIGHLWDKIGDRNRAVVGGRLNVIGQRIRQIRLERGLSADELAGDIGTTARDLLFYEEKPDGVTNLSLSALQRIADELEVDPSQLIQASSLSGDLPPEAQTVGFTPELAAARGRKGVPPTDLDIIQAYLESKGRKP